MMSATGKCVANVNKAFHSLPCCSVSACLLLNHEPPLSAGNVIWNDGVWHLMIWGGWYVLLHWKQAEWLAKTEQLMSCKGNTRNSVKTLCLIIVYCWSHNVFSLDAISFLIVSDYFPTIALCFYDSGSLPRELQRAVAWFVFLLVWDDVSSLGAKHTWKRKPFLKFNGLSQCFKNLNSICVWLKGFFQKLNRIKQTDLFPPTICD